MRMDIYTYNDGTTYRSALGQARAPRGTVTVPTIPIPAEPGWRFDEATYMWHGPGGVEVECCDRCGALPFVTHIDHRMDPDHGPEASYATLCGPCSAMPSYPEGAWAVAW